MIEVDRVSKQFGNVRAVSDVSLRVEPGVVTGLLGPNGAGKTTLIRMMTSFITPTSGAISICGHDAIEDAGAARRCIGYLPESAPSYPEMRVEQYLHYRAKLYSVPRARRSAAVGEAMTRCAITDMARRRIGQLSKGYRQRVGLAAAVLHDPEVLILDEPSSGLDPAQIRELRLLIRRLAEGGPSGKRVVLLSSHYLHEAQQTCDRITIIARGRLRADGTPDQLLQPLRTAAPIIAKVTSNTPPTAASLKNDFTPGALGLPPAWAINATAEDKVVTLAIRPNESGPNAANIIARALNGRGWPLHELRRDEPTLEQFFISVVEQADEPEKSEAAA